MEWLVILGVGLLLGYVKEVVLKCLELINGDLISYFEILFGFCYGFKIIINDKIVVLLMLLSDKYSSFYDMDLYNELVND